MQDISSLRQQLRQQRRLVRSAEAKKAAVALLEQFLLLPHHQWHHIAVYFPTDGEIDPSCIVEWCWQNNKKCYLPCINKTANKNMQFIIYTDRSLLTENRYHIAEPVEDKAIAVSHLDLMLLPLVAFDHSGNRLGRGGGYYDVTLSIATPTPFLLGLAYDFQQVETLISKPTDIKLHGVLTPHGFLAF